MSLAATALGATRPSRSPHSVAGVAALGEPGARLLAGSGSREGFTEHLARVGELPRWASRSPELLQILTRSGLTGRGGAHFPLARKVQAALRGEGPAVVVVNGTESEPASTKDRLLLQLRPHLVIDGALTVAAACGASEVIIALHAGSPALRSVTAAVSERGDCEIVRVETVPDRYIAGESSALVSWLGGGAAVPVSRARPTAECGLGGRPTVVSNTETVCHVGLLARAGSLPLEHAGVSSRDSRLVTMAGDVPHPGRVLEVTEPVPLSDLVGSVCGHGEEWQAVLIGGYGGTWVDRAGAACEVVNPVGGSTGCHDIGCGLIGVLGPQRCGLAEASRLVRWLASQRAGQCGACAYGLPLVAEEMELVATGGRGIRRSQRRVASLAHSVTGRGLCGLPDATIAMAESALVAFASEGELHRRGRCSARNPPGAFPLPAAWGPPA